MKRSVAVLLSGLAAVAGCRDQPEGEATAAALTVPLPPVTQFAVLAARTVAIGDRAVVTGGHLGVAAGATNSMTTGADAQAGVGRVLLAPVMTLRDRTVAGEIGANTITVGVNVTTGPRSAYVAPPAAPAISAFTAGSDTVTVNTGQTQTLAAGDHGNVTVNGTLNLSGGTYEIQSLRIGVDGRVVANAASLVRIQTGIQIGDRGDLVASGALGAGGLRVVVNGTIDGNVNSASLGTDVLLTGIVVARNVFRTGDRLVATGAISAQDVILGNDSRLTFAVGFGCTNNAGCNDNNPCTTDTCVDAACVHGNAPNGTACSDGNPCTQTDTCQAGTCTGGNPVVCVAGDQCHVPGTCNTATGICSNPNAPNGTACNDNNACTQTSTCQAGTCTGANPVVCAPLDQCHVGGVCNPANGTCSNPNAPNGTACSDGNACTLADTCQSGMCSGGPPVVCGASDQCHAAGACNPASGTCSNPNAPDGTACNDGSVCTAGDTCRGGICTGGSSIVTEYASGLPQPKQITPGPDGNLWFVSTEVVPGVGAVARFVPASGAVTAFLTNAAPRTEPLLVDDIVAAPDGNLWFTGRDPAAEGLPVLATITPAGTFIVPDLRGSSGSAIAVGPDGNLWSGGNFLGVTDVVWRQTSIATFVTVSTTPHALVAGPDANLWLVASNGAGSASVGRVAPNDPGNEVLTEFPVSTPGELNDIASGPDGNLWFTDAGNNEIGRITPAGAVAKFAVPTAASGLHGIIAGPDGNLWFTESAANKIGRITPTGAVSELACIPTANSGPTNITVGADGRLWLTETNAGNIARVQLP